MHDGAARSDQHREAQRELVRIDLERPQPLPLLGEQDRRRLPGRPRVCGRRRSCSRSQIAELAGDVGLVDEGRRP